MRNRTIAPLAVAGLVLGLLAVGSTAQSADEAGVVHFTAAGDYGTHTATRDVLSGIADAAPDLHIALGDLRQAVPGTEDAWCELVKSEVGNGFPFELVAGNHDSGHDGVHINNFSACLPNQLPGAVGTYGREYYVDVPQGDPLVRFVMISPDIPFSDGSGTYTYTAGNPRYNWTAAAIDGARNTGIPWVVVAQHKPCFSIGDKPCEPGTDLIQLLLSKRVDLVLTGHDHLYARTHQLGLGTGCAAMTPNTFDADCIADSDTAMAQGAGTVFATAGTGGTALRNVNTADPEIGWFGAYSGANRNPTHGFLDVRATADRLTAQFVPRATGAFTDSFTIDRGAPPPNAGPTAAFSSSVTGLTAAFDGRLSSDPDGPIASYSWSFGDDTAPATGPQPSHTYATAGTYQVTLTVTDGAGATHAVTQPVTVTEPPPGPVDFVLDGFGRTVTGGWGTADAGGPWTTSGTATNFAVTGGAGVITLPGGGQNRAVWLGGTAQTDTDLRLTLALDKVPTGNGAYLDVAGRRTGTNSEYRTRMVMRADGRIVVQLTALRGTASAVGLAPAVTLPPSISYAANTQLHVRMQVTGLAPTTIRFKAWPAVQPEPAAWQTTATDGTPALQNPGGVGLTSYLSGSVTNGPIVVRVDDVSARPAG